MLPALAIVASSLLWGGWWMPLRHLGDGGLSGSWATATVYGAGFLCLAPVVLARTQFPAATLRFLALIALFAGASLAAWNHALLVGDVVRSMLLFFVSPIWATLFARLFLKQPVTWWRMVSIPLGLLGAAVVLGAETSLPVPRTEGEVSALVAGMLFAVASVVIRASTDVADIAKTAATFLGCTIGACTLASVLPMGAPPTWGIVAGAPFALLFALAILLPATWLEIWGNSRLDPGAVNVIFQLEIVVAAVTAGLLTDEPLGRRELIGGALIVTAGLIETLRQGRVGAEGRTT